MAELGLADFDIVFVAIGDNLETSILTTLVLKEAGVKVWVKARDKFHAKILQKVGADKVINPGGTWAAGSPRACWTTGCSTIWSWATTWC